MIPVRENNEVVLVYPDVDMTLKISNNKPPVVDSDVSMHITPYS